MKNKITAIIQARMGSSRLPGKSMMDIFGKTLIERVIDRVSLAKKVEQIVLATTIAIEDENLVNLVSKKYPEIKIFRGSKENVVERFVTSSRKFFADPIIRITADDPFKDPHVIDLHITKYFKESVDYVSNTLKHTFPEGIDTEIFSLAALARAEAEGKSKMDREHVTFYIWNHPDIFRLKNIRASMNYSRFRLTVDYKKDLQMAIEIYKHFSPRIDFSYIEIVNFLQKNPRLFSLNSSITRYESLNRN